MPEIEEILDRRISISTRGKKYKQYIVKWKDRPMEYSSCISQAKVDNFGFHLALAK